MNQRISKEFWMLAGLIFAIVLIFKGWYLDWWHELQEYRQESTELHQLVEARASSGDWVPILDARIAQAQLLLDRYQVASMSQSTWGAQLQAFAKEHGVDVELLEHQQDDQWKLSLKGSVPALTAWLYACETSEIPLNVMEWQIHQAGDRCDSTLLFEVVKP